jgi:hypothetical protein
MGTSLLTAGNLNIAGLSISLVGFLLFRNAFSS